MGTPVAALSLTRNIARARWRATVRKGVEAGESRADADNVMRTLGAVIHNSSPARAKANRSVATDEGIRRDAERFSVFAERYMAYLERAQCRERQLRRRMGHMHEEPNLI